MAKKEFSLYFDNDLIERFDARIPPQYRSKIISEWILDFLENKKSVNGSRPRTQGKTTSSQPKQRGSS